MRVSTLLPAALVAAMGFQSVAAAHGHGASGLSVTQHDKRTLGLLCNILPRLCKTSTPKYNYPPQNWQCGGRGDDGWEFDWQGNRLPSGWPSDWRWFGVSYGWGPPRNWGIPSRSWKYPSGCSLHRFTWWAPSTNWIVPVGFNIPSFWGGFGWSIGGGGGRPSPDWQCNDKGDDGYEHDHDGNDCPYDDKDAFRWFGKKYGWQPRRGWTPSLSWREPRGFNFLAPWFLPPFSWQPFYIETRIPAWWGSQGWYRWPKSDWSCNNSGDDGWDRDHQGNSCPSQYPSSWKFFGKSKGWHPPRGWSCASNWQVPQGWNYNVCTWWRPSNGWRKPIGFTIPKLWISLGFFLKE